MKRIIVLGGGFGGLATAEHLDRLLRYDDDVDIVLISETNFLFYTPMLGEVAGGTIEPRYAVPPLRMFLRKKTRFQEAVVEGVDVAAQKVHVTYAKGGWDQWSTNLSYDYLVIALGAVTDFERVSGVSQYAFGLKHVLDAMFLRNRVLTLLERADASTDVKERREMLTFVVAGGGYSGVEGVAALEDLAHGALQFYPSIRPEELRFILAPHGIHLLHEIDARLGEYVVDKFRQRSIEVRLGVGVTEVSERSATLSNGEIVPTRTVIWTAGVEANPVLRQMNLPLDRHGAAQVNGQLQVLGHPTIFAVGDCAAVPMPEDSGFYTPTAQNAIREGPVAAANVAALLHNSNALKTFDYKPVGGLASLGQRQAVAQIGPIHLSGLPAWFAWRGVYLAKLPSLEDKALVLLDWVADVFRRPDVAQLPISRASRLYHLEGTQGTPGAQLQSAQPAGTPS